MKTIFNNKLLLILSILIPLIFFQLIGIVFSNSDNFSKIPIALIDNDNSIYSKKIIRNLENSELLRTINTNFENAISLLKKNKIEAIYIIKKGFYQNILNDTTNKMVELYYLEDSFVAKATSDIVASEILPIISDFKTAKNVAYLYEKYNISSYNEAFDNSLNFSNLLREKNEFILPIKFIIKNPKSSIKVDSLNNNIILKNSVIGLCISFTTIFLFFSSSTILKEKNSNVINRLRLIGYNNVYITLSNIIGIFFIGISLIILQFIIFLFYIDISSGIQFLNALIIFITYILSISCLIVLLTTIFNNNISFQSFALPFVMFLALLGGSFFSIELFPKEALVLAKLNPFYWANDGLFKIIVLDLPFNIIKKNLVLLIMISILFLVFDIFLKLVYKKTTP